MLKSTKNFQKNVNRDKNIMIIYDSDMQIRDLLNDVFNQLFEEIRVKDLISDEVISDLQFIIHDFIDFNFSNYL